MNQTAISMLPATAKTTPKAQVITTEGQMIEIYDDVNANALFQNCMTNHRKLSFLNIELDNQIKFIPLHRVKEVVFYDVEDCE
jgi:hypothetical protein